MRSFDSAQLPEGDRYGYCRYNPFKYVDPSGEFAEGVTMSSDPGTVNMGALHLSILNMVDELVCDMMGVTIEDGIKSSLDRKIYKPLQMAIGGSGGNGGGSTSPAAAIGEIKRADDGTLKLTLNDPNSAEGQQLKGMFDGLNSTAKGRDILNNISQQMVDWGFNEIKIQSGNLAGDTYMTTDSDVNFRIYNNSKYADINGFTIIIDFDKTFTNTEKNLEMSKIVGVFGEEIYHIVQVCFSPHKTSQEAGFSRSQNINRSNDNIHTNGYNAFQYENSRYRYNGNIYRRQTNRQIFIGPAIPVLELIQQQYINLR